LHAALQAQLEGLGFVTDGRRFRPHVTLARRAGASPALPSGPPVSWPVHGFVLVQSHPGPAGYEVLRVTWRQVTEEPKTVVAAIRSRLG